MLNAQTALPRPTLVGAAGLYCTGDESLRVTSLNAVASVALTIGGRFLQLGAVVPIALEERHVPTTDRTVTTTDHKLGDGWLQGVTVIASAGSPPIGGCYVRVDLVRGRGTSATVLGTLLQGYVSGSQRRTWPGATLESAVAGPGRLRSIAGTNPAAGVEISETVPTGAVWRLLGWRATFVTAAVAATRRVVLTIDDGVTVVWEAAALDAQITTLTRTYAAAVNGNYAVAQTLTRGIPGDLPDRLPAGARIRTVTENLQGADDWSAPQMLVEDWIAGD